jgi:hypothetical protein
MGREVFVNTVVVGGLSVLVNTLLLDDIYF